MQNIGSPPQVRGKLPWNIQIVRETWITPAGAGKTWIERTGETLLEDHPRRCGENANYRYAYRRGGGSPPQVRGKPASSTMRFALARITPAGAGKTIYCCTRQAVTADHPRRCGENKHTGRRRIERLGSPPQVRGKLSHRHHIPCNSGITPAGAGKTQWRLDYAYTK